MLTELHSNVQSKLRLPLKGSFSFVQIVLKPFSIIVYYATCFAGGFCYIIKWVEIFHEVII